MRIITGKAKGIKLKTLEGDNTRPTAERVKEAIFSMIQFDIEGRVVLDLFSGSGQMGLEAVSRGAVKAVLVEKAKPAYYIIKENIEKTRLQDQVTAINSDFLDFIRRKPNERFDIIFLDPPYRSGFYEIALKALYDADMLKPTSMIICESAEDNSVFETPEVSSRFEIQKQNGYSKTLITILSPKL